MNYRNIFILINALFIGLTFSCKNDYDKAIEDEEIKIKEYLQKNNLDVKPQENGLYYINLEQGDGDSIKTGDFISFNVNMDEIDKNLNPSNTKNNLYAIVGDNPFIKGIDEGFKLMVEGEKARFIIPFAFGYYSPNAVSSNYLTYIADVEINEKIDDPDQWELNRIMKFVDTLSVKYDTLDMDSTTGFTFISVKEGTGANAEYLNHVDLTFRGFLIDMTLFSDYYESRTFSVSLDSSSIKQDELTKGLIEGVLRMKEGGQAIIVVPSAMGYGRKYGTIIHSYATLVYNVILNDIQ